MVEGGFWLDYFPPLAFLLALPPAAFLSTGLRLFVSLPLNPGEAPAGEPGKDLALGSLGIALKKSAIRLCKSIIEKAAIKCHGRGNMLDSSVGLGSAIVPERVQSGSSSTCPCSFVRDLPRSPCPVVKGKRMHLALASNFG